MSLQGHAWWRKILNEKSRIKNMSFNPVLAELFETPAEAEPAAV